MVGALGAASPRTRALEQWTEEERGTKSGRNSSRIGERYLPQKSTRAAVDAESCATSGKKRRDLQRGTGDKRREPTRSGLYEGAKRRARHPRLCLAALSQRAATVRREAAIGGTPRRQSK